MSDFDTFEFADPISRAIAEAGFTDPTPIQVQTIPLAKAGDDILGIAQTGTGKTLAFAAPTLHKLCSDQHPAPRKGCRVLVLSPTRELVAQIAESFQTLAKYMGVRVVTAFGGVKISTQKRQLERGAHVLVAAPGRLEDLIAQGFLTLDHVDTLIVDEADQMFDLGFVQPLKRIVAQLPKERQTLFFSATMPRSIRQMAESFLSNPKSVSVTPPATTAERVTQSAYFIAPRDKPRLLSKVLAAPAVEQVLVFTRTKHGADKVVRLLARDGIDAVAIHGNKSQPQRRKALDLFKSGKVKAMVATDIAARGLDISGLSHVVNYELPNVPEQYVHRIGRTGRAGADGVAISFVAGDEKGYLRDIEKQIRMKIPLERTPEGIEADNSDVPPPKNRRQSSRGRGRGRPGDAPKKGKPTSKRSGPPSAKRKPFKASEGAGPAKKPSGSRPKPAAAKRRRPSRPKASSS